VCMCGYIGVRVGKCIGQRICEYEGVGTWRYSTLQIGWHRISRIFVNHFRRTRILPMGFTSSTM